MKVVTICKGYDHTAICLGRQQACVLCVPTIGLLTIVAHSAEASLLAKAIKLIDEEDAGSVGTRPLEHVPDAGGANAHKHLHELSASCCVEGHSCLTSNGFGQQGLACTKKERKEKSMLFSDHNKSLLRRQSGACLHQLHI